MRPHLSALLAILLWGTGIPAEAQQIGLSAAERQVAAEAAYDRGTRAYRGGDYAQAARWWETANELAPAAAAVLQAIRAHGRAGNELRAGTLAAHVAAEYGEDRLGRQARALTRAAETGFRVDVVCRDPLAAPEADEEAGPEGGASGEGAAEEGAAEEGAAEEGAAEEAGGASCQIEINGEAEVFRSFFFAPDVEHVVVATFDRGSVEQRVHGGAGERREVVFERPAPEPEVVPEEDRRPDGQRTPEPARTQVRVDESGGGISPAIFVVGLALMAAAGAVASWSWLDTLDAAEQYETMPTREALDAGRDLELRTTILVVATGALGAASLVTLLLTDFGGGDEETRPGEGARVGLAPLPEGGLALSAGGRF